MLVRSYDPSDANAVNAVALAAFAQYDAVYEDLETLRAAVGATSELAEQGELIVAEEAGRIAGAVVYCAAGSQPWAAFFDPAWPIIRMLVVDPAARGRGIGRRLTEECIARARRGDAEVIALHTSPAMEVALSLYLRIGFRLERRLPDRYGVPYAVYLLPLRETAVADGASALA
jgi:ribosomal protein S18 acetylase RimI-like enzyme